MSKSVDKENILNTMPEDYTEISLWLKENKKFFINQPLILTDVLRKLNEMLQKAETISDLKKDMNILVETIQIEKDALLKEFNANFTVEKFIEFINDDKSNDFFVHCRQNEKSYAFVDILNLDVESREKNKQRTVRETVLKEQESAIKYEKYEGNTETNEEIENLKKLVKKKGVVKFEQYVCDKESFSKTIFNVFNVSLAIKMKYVGLKKENREYLLVKPNESVKEGNKNVHGIFEITKKKWREMIDKQIN